MGIFRSGTFNWDALAKASENIGGLISSVAMDDYTRQKNDEEWKKKIDYQNTLGEQNAVAASKRGVAASEEESTFRHTQDAQWNQVQNDPAIKAIFDKMQSKDPAQQPSLAERDIYNQFMDMTGNLNGGKLLTPDQLATVKETISRYLPSTAANLLAWHGTNQTKLDVAKQLADLRKSEETRNLAEANRANREPTSAQAGDIAAIRESGNERKTNFKTTQTGFGKRAEIQQKIDLYQQQDDKLTLDLAKTVTMKNPDQQKLAQAAISQQKQALQASIRDAETYRDQLESGIQGLNPAASGLFPDRTKPETGSFGLSGTWQGAAKAPVPPKELGLELAGSPIEGVPDKTGLVIGQVYRSTKSGILADYIGPDQATGKPMFKAHVTAPIQNIDQKATASAQGVNAPGDTSSGGETVMRRAHTSW